MKIFKAIVNLVIGLSGLGVIMHLMKQNDELTLQLQSKEGNLEFWKAAFKSESGLRIAHMFDIMEWKRLYKKYGFNGMNWYDEASVERLMKESGDKDEEAEDPTKEK